MAKKFYSTGDIANEIRRRGGQISEERVRQLFDAGELSGHKIGRYRSIPAAEAEAFIDAWVKKND